MSTAKISSTNQALALEPTRQRETPRPTTVGVTFQNVLRGGASVLLAGAQAASTVVGGPLLSAAVGRARAGVDALGQQATERAPAASSATSSVDALQALQEQRAGEDLKLLALQSTIQQHDRQIQLVSNVMKARHDTAKAAITNIRS